LPVDAFEQEKVLAPESSFDPAFEAFFPVSDCIESI
jgi:hypothetical protein